MTRTVINNLDEKDFVTSLIMSDKCCNILIPYIKLSYFENEYTRIVIQWVIEYYKSFNTSPKKDIVSLYRVHVDELSDDALKDLILAYLTKISESEYEINNEDYLLDKSRNFLEYKSMQEYVGNLNACLETKSMDKAREIQSDYQKVTIAETNECDLMNPDDIKIIENAITQQEEVLFTLPGELNKVVGNIHRNDFVAFLSGPKKGKTFALQYTALQALRQSLNVVVISMEMTREEVIQRFWKMMFGAKSGLVKSGTYETGKFVEDPTEKGKFRYELFDVNVTDKQRPPAEELQKQYRAFINYSGHLKIVAYPAFSASVKEITDKIEEYAKDGFVADVVIIDYADITKPIGGGSEVRNQLDAIWKYLRAFAMKFHCCVITASQTNRSGYSSSRVGAEAIAEDFRKLAHITSLCSLEQTPKMKKEHLMRIRNVAMRNGDVTDACIFSQCLPLGQYVFGDIISADSLIYDVEDEEE